jgi:ABC-type multidrug transport system ATPase subunit
MNEKILKALIQLFVFVLDIEKSQNVEGKERRFVQLFLSALLNKDQIPEYLALFDEYLKLYTDDIETISAKRKRKRGMLDAMRVMSICEQINKELQQEQKTFVLLKLLEFISLGEKESEKELDFVLSVATAFNISETEYLNCKNFVFNTINSIPEKRNVLVINSDKTNLNDPIQHKNIGVISGNIVFLHISSTNTLAFWYRGKQDIYLNGQTIISSRIYIFNTGSSLKSANVDPLYYTDVIKAFMKIPAETQMTLTAKNVAFNFKGSENGVRVSDLSVSSGQLIGVMGGSGTGKSTLLNILNGNIKPDEGSVQINGNDLYTKEHVEMFNGVIGYVTQDDILFEELTVFQNLQFNTELCLNNYTDEERNVAVENMLYDLDLFEIKDLVVGDVLNKFISGGQRKRLNIALELIREPSILFVDEPTSGLSSLDSEIVMNLLKEQALKGKIVIANIHQPSSDIYKMFDKVLFLDKGGYLIYDGNPIDAIHYFKSKSMQINAGEEQCYECGNVNTEQLLQIIEARIVNEYGKVTRIRKISPKEWYELFNSSHKKDKKEVAGKRKLPHNLFSIPGKFEQFQIFLKRDFYAKLTNRQYLLISFLEAPILAIFLGFFTKHMSGKTGNRFFYIFQDNENLPAFIFMSVVIALFIGLSISAEEIIRDRKYLKRESFLGLSFNSYLDSKIVLLFVISAVQMLTFVVIGHLILEIKGMTLHYWIMLFSVSCFANLLGLNLSSALNSVITIYILIPFILVPQLLFSGVMVRYDKLHPAITSQSYVPIIGDAMTSRWAYEGLIVHQFKTNKYQQHFFDIEEDLSRINYASIYVLPELRWRISFCKNDTGSPDYNNQRSAQLKLIRFEIDKLGSYTGKPFLKSELLNSKAVTTDVLDGAEAYLSELKALLNEEKSIANKKLELQYNSLITAMNGEDQFKTFKQNYFNNSIRDLVTNRNEFVKIMQVENRLVQQKDPIYKKSRFQLWACPFIRL